MAFSHGSRAKLLAGGYDLSGYLRSVSFSGSSDTAEVTTLGDTAKDYIAGLQDATLSAEGLYDGALGASDEILSAALGSNPVLFVHCPAGDAAGAVAYGFNAIQTSYQLTTPVDDVAAATVEAQSTVGKERLLVHHALAAETAGADGSDVDNAASTADGGVGYLMVTDFTGTDATIKIQHSADGSSWTDLLTFTQVDAANVAERLTVAGAVNQHTRASVSGTFTSITYLAAFGRS